MTIAATSESRNEAAGVKAGCRDWRSIIFRGVVGLIATALLAGPGIDLVSPWLLVREATPEYTPALHR